jgi:hypothetical protein
LLFFSNTDVKANSEKAKEKTKETKKGEGEAGGNRTNGKQKKEL